MTSKVILPTYDVRTICDYLSHHLATPLVPDNINFPTAEVVQVIFCKFLRQAVDVPEYSLTTLPLSASVEFDNELHRKSVPPVIIYHTLKSFVKDTTDGKLLLSMCDLVSPANDVPKLKKLLSFFVDFMKFQEVMNPLVEDVLDKMSEQREKITVIEQELMIAENRKTELVSHHAARKRREVELSNEVHKVNEELKAVQKKYEAMTAEKEEVAKKMEEAIVEKKRLDAETEILKNNIELLSSELMSSPVRIKSEMSDKKRQIDELETLIAESKTLLEKRRRALDIYVNAEKMMSWMNEKSKALVSEKNRVQCLADQLMNNERSVEELEQRYEFTCDEKNAFDAKMKEMAENQSELKHEHLDRITSLQKSADDVKKDIERMCKSQPSSTQDIDKKNSDLLAVRNAISDLKRRSVQEATELVSEFEKLLALNETNLMEQMDRERAVERLGCRLGTAMKGKRSADITFSTSTLMDVTNRGQNETDESYSDNVFK